MNIALWVIHSQQNSESHHHAAATDWELNQPQGRLCAVSSPHKTWRGGRNYTPRISLSLSFSLSLSLFACVCVCVCAFTHLHVKTTIDLSALHTFSLSFSHSLSPISLFLSCMIDSNFPMLDYTIQDHCQLLLRLQEKNKMYYLKIKYVKMFPDLHLRAISLGIEWVMAFLCFTSMPI